MTAKDETYLWREKIEEKLKRDQDLLTFVSDSLKRSDQLTKGMVSILSSLEGRLEHLENSVIPMHNSTQNLLQLKGTTQKTLFYLDDAISHYQAVRDTDKVIIQGPTGRLSDYLACVHRLKKAEEYFQQEDPDGPELNMLRGRLESAKSQLESEFQVLLGRYSKPVQTVRILDVLDKKSLNGSAGGVEEVQLIPQTRLQDIISISTWLIGEDAALTAKRRVSASKFKTRSLERNPSHHSQGKLEPSSFFTNKSYCSKLKTQSLGRKPSIENKPSMDSLGKLKANSLFTKMIGLKSFGKFKTLSLDRKPSLDKNSSLDSLGKLESSSSFTKVSTSKPYSRLNIPDIRQPSLESIPFLPRDSTSHTFPSCKPKPPASTSYILPYFRPKPSSAFDLKAHYAMVRSNQLDCSMKGLKDHKSRNLLCPVLQSRRVDSAVKKNKKTGRDSILHIEIETYMACITAFLSLAKSEYTMVSKVFPLNCSNTFETLIQVALNQLIQNGENIVSSVRRACSRHDYTALVAMLPVLGRLLEEDKEFNMLLKCTTSGTLAKFSKLVTSMKTLAARALTDFSAHVKNNPDRESMSKDGTVHEFNSNTILFLQQLLSFADAVRSILYPHDVDSDTVTMEVSSSVQVDVQHDTDADESEEQPSDSQESKGNDDQRALSPYVCKVLEHLQYNLQSKAKVYEDHALGAIFLLNNYNYILKSIKNWLKVTECLTEKNLPTFKPGDKLKEKDCQVIKDKFKSFNEGLEELYKAQKAWAIPDREQRQAICQAQREMVSKAYIAFLLRCDHDFSKHPERYHKYSPAQVEEMIERLFDISA
ncbi:exocyst complex component 7 isoform X5 [Oncorhynchus kisutch]|uniref:exocyst complex component 7 isoform X5 n=1 Tax=Oncorhynchus kisutch TaxID=8019 RepID=UPI0012DCA14E|nr:exocyst complex component 7 isoform X5 [Oncorhynchus kisutch]XP_031673845.1 exocyst complex component 7 isoform X5 [Oncorhynchus kisutch]